MFAEVSDEAGVTGTAAVTTRLAPFGALRLARLGTSRLTWLEASRLARIAAPFTRLSGLARLESYEGVLPGFDAVLDLTRDYAPFLAWLEARGHDVSIGLGRTWHDASH